MWYFINEDLRQDIEDELYKMKLDRSDLYDEDKFKEQFKKLLLYSNQIDSTNTDGGLIKTLQMFVLKLDEYSTISENIENYYNFILPIISKFNNNVEQIINNLESKNYKSIFNLIESLKTNISKFTLYKIPSKEKAIALDYNKEDIAKISNLNYILQNTVFPIIEKCYNCIYWLYMGGFDNLKPQFQHSTEEEISTALDKCLKGVPPIELGKVLYYSEGNEKLNKNIYIFSLPAGKSCPGAVSCKTSVIVDDYYKRANLRKMSGNEFTCFAANNEALYPGKLYKAMINFKIIKEYCKTVNDKTLALNTMVTGFNDYSIVRVHDSGDFFSTDYMLAWLNVAEMNPNKLFYAYTTSVTFLNKIIKTKGFIPYNFIFIESNENLLRLLNKDADKIIQSIKDNGIFKTRFIFKTFKEAEKYNVTIDVDDTLAMRADISEFGLLLHSSSQTGENRIYADKYSILNMLPNVNQSLIKLYYKLPIEYKNRIDNFYDDLSINSTSAMKNYLNENFKDIFDYIIKNNIQKSSFDINFILNLVKDKQNIKTEKYDILAAYVNKAMIDLKKDNPTLTKDQIKDIIKTKLDNILESI
jgi:hypothetical protein